MRGLCYTYSEKERARAEERTLQPIVKALFMNQLPAGGVGCRGFYGHPGIISASVSVHQSWVCLELPDGRERGVGTAELVF